ncbi:Ser-tRNA(Ala) deacylase AlaX [Streptacidiphilus sp. MAP12-20]|uniref:alanyl-tRNA synthetase n=1 Tax=Streptacidiphilus sp. MAP12-20 TaxID=3156299 RepID=UPI003513D8BC
MQQHQLYLSDTYLGEVLTTPLVTGRGDDGLPWVALADNIFHPQGGGQPSDVGTVDGLPVRSRRHADGLVVLQLVEPAGTPTWPAGIAQRDLPTEGKVVAAIDMEQRKLHAALHTAGHLLHALVGTLGFQHAGNSHFPGQARVDYRVTDREVDREALTAQVNDHFVQAVKAALPVTAEIRDGVRTVSIEGLGGEPCGGTHVPDLSALRDVSVRSIKIKSGLMKIGYTAAHV